MRDYRSVDNRIYNRKPLVEREQLFIKYKGDLLTLHNGRERSAFDGLVESILWKLDCNLVRRVFLTPEMHAKTTDQEVHYHIRSRVDVFASLIITSIISTLLVLPVVLPVVAMYRLTTLGSSSNSMSQAI